MSWLDCADAEELYVGDMMEEDVVSDEFELELYDWKVQNYQGRDDYGLSAKIPLRFAAEAARLLIESQRPGYKLVLHGRIVESEAGDLQ